MNRRILIVGDAGRGKSTFAERLSAKTGIPCCSTDDFYWKVKFSEPNDKQKSIEDIRKVYAGSEWIVDGSTRHLTQDGFEKADIIYFLQFDSLLQQYWFLITRHFKRDNETLAGLLELLVHVTYKKYKKGYGNHLPSLKDMLENYKEKVVRLATLKEINEQLSIF